ncbi:MAG: hypothetical protein EA378_06640 [Phycisphaerales bacterium]|nr:MAG: hypothetical protein EA378_06640 [Phycisphaerales bacterium]
MKKPNTRGRSRSVALACLVLPICALAAPAQAQEGEELLTPPAVREPDSVPTIRTLLVVAILAAAGIGVSFIPSKRGHQD